MSALPIVLISLLAFAVGYIFYASKFERLFEVDANRPTPAHTLRDGIDYVPAKNWLILFGHHFASIAGAGPIIGPVIAVILWGWLPALIWIVFGTIFIGGVHDFCALMISVRHKGKSIADISQEIISKRARIIFSSFVLLALILVVAVFIHLCAKTFVEEPKIVLPSLGLIPVAMVAGFLIYARKINIALVTLFGLISLLCLILLGQVMPINAGANPMLVWSLVLIVYCFFASILPVNILLQPRDYFSSYLLFFTLGLGYLGIIFSRPIINQPPVVALSSNEGFVWPMLFVTVACGAISGFHALIASGTSSKQISSELDAKKIGYGAMVAEGLVALLAVICVLAISAFDKNIDLLAVLKSSSPVGVFGKGFGIISQGIIGRFGSFIAIITLNAFILTTLDTAVRISRYIFEEITLVKNKFISTSIMLLAASFLALSGKWNRIWPAFGASNQLVAALTLLVISSWLLSKGKKVIYTLIPAAIMLLTTIAALVVGSINYFNSHDFLLLIISVILVGLALILSWDAFRLMDSLRRVKNA
ncbi:MAG: carbon starvation protein A [Candidatus Omnitrophota bacterium]